MAPGVAVDPAELEKRRIVGVNEETVTDTTSTDFPGHYPGEDHSWTLDTFRKRFKIEYHYNDPFDASFSLIGIDASVANAFRRILLAEIPTLAIEYVYINNNTSIIQDEVLAHRLGLIPLTGDPEGLKWLEWYHKAEDETSEEHSGTDQNTIVLELKVKCSHNTSAAKDEKDPLKKYHNAHIYARDIVWIPKGRQAEHFKGEGAIQSTNPDILVAKMRPGQEIDLEMHCIKGLGADHAKFSPVCTATYRLLPTITITKPIIGEDAKKFQRCFPRGVIGLKTIKDSEAKAGTDYEGHAGEKKAVVEDAFRDVVARECLRHEEFKNKVKLGRVRDHFIFSVESTGQARSDQLFLESIKVLREKCTKLKRDFMSLPR